MTKKRAPHISEDREERFTLHDISNLSESNPGIRSYRPFGIGDRDAIPVTA
jgi:hypothetical protein